MKWMRFAHLGRQGFGTLDGDAVHVHEGSMFENPRPTGERVPLVQVEWLPPTAPSKMIALWNNFHAAAEKNGWAIPEEPLYFLKTPNSLCAHGQPTPAPAAYEGRVVYEGELAVVIGRTAKALSPDEAHHHIFGYSCANDVTAIEILHRDASFAQWTRAKGFDGFGVYGPVVETEVDPMQSTLRTLVGGRERQSYPLADMIFKPAELVSRISHDMRLDPGDVILCGTSLGVLPMKPGSTVEVTIDGIGSLVNVFAPAA
jgi:2-keto-4-pentenoate hydratase/2-oxohepta-3-ene-1,7-dioic acid hydratase in catechol pathway